MFQILNINLQDYFKPYKVNLHYLNKYENFIKTRSLRPKPNKGNKHHILPRCIFPALKNEEENIIVLTDREHFIAHLLLTRIFYNKNKGLLFAFNLMNGTLNSKYISSRLYEKEKQLVKLELRNRARNRTDIEKKKISEKWRKTWEEKPEEEKILRNKRHSETLQSKPKEYWKNIQIKIKETYSKKTEKESLKISEKKKKGSLKSWSIKKKDKNLMKEISQIRRKNAEQSWLKLSEEERKIRNKHNSEGQLKLSFLVCPYCGFSSRSRGNMKRHHFDNCLKNPNLSKIQLEELKNKRRLNAKKNSESQLNLEVKKCPICDTEVTIKTYLKHLAKHHQILDFEERRRLRKELFKK